MNVAPGATYEAVIDWGATGALETAPAFAGHYLPDMPGSNAVLGSEGTTVSLSDREAFPDFTHLSVSQPQPVTLSTPLRCHIARIVESRPEEQMGRILAGRVVASVTHLDPVRHRTDAEHIPVAVGVDRPIPIVELPIAASITISRPRPTLVRAAFVNLIGVPIGRRHTVPPPSNGNILAEVAVDSLPLVVRGAQAADLPARRTIARLHRACSLVHHRLLLRRCRSRLGTFTRRRGTSIFAYREAVSQ